MITVGEVIKKKRESLGKNLNVVLADTKIQRRFLEYIENNEFDKFDSEVFAVGFLKIYSKYLGLDTDKILALYRRDYSRKGSQTTKTKGKTKKNKRSIKFSPKTLSVTILTLFLLFVLGYIGLQIFKFQTPPKLEILSPNDEYISKEREITIEGFTKPPSIVEIDSKQITVDKQGNFQYTLSLKEGVNTVTVKAKKESNPNLETIKSIKIIYSLDDLESNQEPNREFLLTLSISQSSSWIKLDVDGQNMISQVLQPNTVHEFVVEDTFTLVTGRLPSTQLEINGEEITIQSSDTTGIGQISCRIVENEMVCE